MIEGSILHFLKLDRPLRYVKKSHQFFILGVSFAIFWSAALCRRIFLSVFNKNKRNKAAAKRRTPKKTKQAKQSGGKAPHSKKSKDASGEKNRSLTVAAQREREKSLTIGASADVIMAKDATGFEARVSEYAG